MKNNNGERQNSVVSNSSRFSARKGAIYEAMGQLKIEDDVNDNGGAVDEVEYPDRPGEPDCIYYLRTGTCAYGSRCRFNHPPYSGQGIQEISELPERNGQPECKYYLKTGSCKFGSTCRYHHPQDRHREPIMLNILGLPMRQEEKQCPFYMRTGTCKFGVMCKFDHPQPMSSGNGSPVTAQTASGSNGSSFVPSSGLPYVGGVSDFSITKTTYVSNPSLQVPQNYMPVLLPHQGWSAYTGIMNQSPITTVIANPTPNGQMHPFLTTFSHLPDRPDQPECRDFVNTGSCKYGFDCKYHHPRDKIAPVMSNSLGPLGLPSRPGQAICSYYTQYGLCRYGPTCHFDHPWPGYLYNYNFGVSSALFDPSMLPYQWNSPIVLTAETSPSKSTKYPDLRNAEVIKKGQSSNSRNFEEVHLNALPNSSERSIEVPQDESD